ncbi:MAG: RidA family protein [Pantoea sp.]|uniref:RidA family protein n=1 Tax=Pantoea sp. TaxID=69393 RepID=UPI00239A138A|nr:RidA family protein [Pantoea sp.]MDE1189032.1 RidA family protein [Pantoea sp.]
MIGPKHIVQPKGLPSGSGWSHIVSGAGTIVHISGQIAVDENNDIIGRGDLELQIRQVYKNLSLCLKELNVGWEKVVKITYYATDIHHALPLMREIREEIMPEGNRPANTFIEVSALANPDLLFEADAVVIY